MSMIIRCFGDFHWTIILSKVLPTTVMVLFYYTSLKYPYICNQLQYSSSVIYSLRLSGTNIIRFHNSNHKIPISIDYCSVEKPFELKFLNG